MAPISGRCFDAVPAKEAVRALGFRWAWGGWLRGGWCAHAIGGQLSPSNRRSLPDQQPLACALSQHPQEDFVQRSWLDLDPPGDRLGLAPGPSLCVCLCPVRAGSATASAEAGKGQGSTLRSAAGSEPPPPSAAAAHQHVQPHGSSSRTTNTFVKRAAALQPRIIVRFLRVLRSEPLLAAHGPLTCPAAEALPASLLPPCRRSSCRPAPSFRRVTLPCAKCLRKSCAAPPLAARGRRRRCCSSSCAPSSGQRRFGRCGATSAGC